MTKNTLTLLFLFCMLSASLISSAQNADSSQFNNKIIDEDRAHSFFNNIISNPAYTGIFGGHNILINAGIDKPFFTFRDLYTPLQCNIAYDVAFGKERNNAIGAYYSDITGGIFHSKSIGLTYARNINLTDDKKFYHKLRVGASVSYNQTANDWSLASFGDMIDPSEGFIWNTQELRIDTLMAYLKADFGLWYHNPVFYFGLATKNIFQPDTSKYGMTMLHKEFNISTGGKINIDNNFSINPSLNMNIVWGYGGKLSTFSPALFGSFKNKCFLGVSYKDMNKITVHAGVMAFDFVSLAVAYGISTNKDLDGFGYPAYIGGDLRINIKNQH